MILISKTRSVNHGKELLAKIKHSKKIISVCKVFWKCIINNAFYSQHFTALINRLKKFLWLIIFSLHDYICYTNNLNLPIIVMSVNKPGLLYVFKLIY